VTIAQRPPSSQPTATPARADARGAAPRSRPASDPLWYKDAIIYELHVRAFRDSKGDGTGDFVGLTERLDYLQDLGVTAIWILPFYPSPLLDDGYDIADFTNVNPDYGTLRDVRTFIREAHRRGLRVITELVCNHTSDQHPWFQRARRSPPGSPWRDFYVWSDTAEKYQDARIIFKDFETSNWTWDPVARAYYWHRFYSHQPDLNFDNPRVRAAIMRTMDVWLEMGVDGLRLDAIPYLYEREGTNCENLPETHAFLRELRRHIDQRFVDRMLLAEANQWPEDSAAYFGNGDECHMAFHFPVMPRMFMSIRMEDRFPIIDILAQTPAIPEACQWAMFLRNHDELTLEMVTDEERDYMYRAYASDPQARINLGIRRRLAPLLANDSRRIELMNGLLFALPGTPVIYYGDEIGMGDNVFLGDRNSVRTPMQWSGDRNAGFSSANRQRLYLPVILDPEYHYEAINVEAQQLNPSSLLWWMKRLIALRKRHPAFGRGSIEFLHPDNRRVLAFVRSYEGETILVVANLSRFVQWAELDLSAFEGATPVELFGQVEFPTIGTSPYFLSLGPHAFMWLALTRPSTPARRPSSLSELPTLPAVRALPDLVTGVRRSQVADLLADWAKDRRWFRGKARSIRSADVKDAVPLTMGRTSSLVVVLGINFTEGDPDDYLVPLMALPSEAAASILAETPWAAIARLGGDAGAEASGEEPGPDVGGDELETANAGPQVLVDAMQVPAFSEELLAALSGRRRLHGLRGELATSPTRLFRTLRGPASERLPATPSRAEQSNSSVIFGDRLMMKLYRRLEPGINPDLEIGKFLTDRGFERIAPVAGSLEYRGRDSQPATAAIVQAYVPNEGDAWSVTQDVLSDYLERAAATAATSPPPPVGSASAATLLERARLEVPRRVRETVGAYLDTAELLGTRTGELHRMLASDPDNPAFAPEPFTPLDQRSLYQSVRSTVRQNLRLLSRKTETLPEPAMASAQAVLGLEAKVDERLNALLARKLGGLRIRCHGDYHLGQILSTGRDFVIIDFEGEPGRPLSERRLKRLPLTDVASMLRSFDYAASGMLLQVDGAGTIRPEDVANLEAWARLWYVWVSAAFLRGYTEATREQQFVPADPVEAAILLDALLLHKGFYELNYELNNRPDWVTIPLKGILSLLNF
jgi:maltose alpha-D-glucosyltransferase / alpha-amylase